MAISRRFLAAIPEGHQIFGSFEVAGVRHRKESVAAFIKGIEHDISLVRDSGNEFDENAVAVYGTSKGLLFRRKRHIGYVPAEIAEQLVKSEMMANAYARLRKIALTDNGFVSVEMDITAPKELVKKARKSG